MTDSSRTRYVGLDAQKDSIVIAFVDRDDRIDAIPNRYLAPIPGPVMITAGQNASVRQNQDSRPGC